MNLYMISQNDNTGYDTYDSAVVCAEDENEAKKISPSPVSGQEHNFSRDNFSWASSIDRVDVEFVGIAGPNQKKGLILSSFNAG